MIFVPHYLMVAAAIEEVGTKPFEYALSNVMGSWPLLNKSWDHNKFNLLETYSKMAREGQGYLITIYVSANQEDPRTHILFFDEASLGLPSKKMYYRSTAEKTRKAYMALMKNLTTLFAEDLKLQPSADLDKQLREIFEFEAAIANVRAYTMCQVKQLLHTTKQQSKHGNHRKIRFSAHNSVMYI